MFNPWKTVFLIAVITFIVIEVTGQNKISYQRSTSVLEFRDSITGKLVRVVKLDDVNPYTANYRPKSSNLNKLNSITRFYSEPLVSETSKSGVAVTFTYSPYTQDNMLLEDLRESTIIVYDTRGRARLVLNHLSVDSSKPLLSQNGKFLGFNFGGLTHDVSDKNMEIGFRIYDVQTKKLIHEIDAPEVAGSYSRNQLFIFGIPMPHTIASRQYYVFDTIQGVLYEQTFGIEELRRHKGFDRKGMIFSAPGLKDKVVTYKKMGLT